MKKLLSILLIGTISIVMLAGCATSDNIDTTDTTDTKNTTDTVDTKDTISPVASATQLGDFKAQDPAGNEVTKNIFSDYDLTLVNLFTTWCSPCIEEIPNLNAVDQEMADQGVNVIGIVLDVNEDGKIDQDKLDKLNQIIKSTKAEYDIILPDEVLRSGRLKGVSSVPESFFVDKNGNIVGETYVGSHSKAEWTEIVENELAKLKK